ncbi:glutamate mutase, MutL [Thermaerobacter marianensis DSM 12885]|uniref:Glutamate mutase, MutL n=2 Tax=Thermaerobacter marianensis TaxID=73919 RepID=E6SKT8_THEM7|nr:glutamate mutase, MutL [Thermaerobacter marianensis DSM 12885]
MNVALLVDFGSTFTKVSAVDLDQPRLLARAQAPTTYATGLEQGLDAALAALEQAYGAPLPPFRHRLACSSAGGGLRMVAVGLVPGLTAEAARRAALGAGARLLATFSGSLGPADRDRLAELNPDIVLVAGGTDGGNRTALLDFARALAGCPTTATVVVAGNRDAAPEAAAILERAGKAVVVVDNVLPRLDTLQVEPAREAIRRIFMEHIVVVRGWKDVEARLGAILMPTPAAALRGAELLADGAGDEPGLGELLVVDVGGATTDVHSVAAGLPADGRTVLRGLPPPRSQRTVEGDLGLRHGAPSLVEAAGLAAGGGEAAARWQERARRRAAEPPFVPGPDEPAEREADQELARAAVGVAVDRHAGRREPLATPHGRRWIQRGKDLRGVRHVVGTGGIFRHAPDPAVILAAALDPAGEGPVLKPRAATLWVDRHYLLSHAGLLAEVDPVAALKILKAGLTRVA